MHQMLRNYISASHVFAFIAKYSLVKEHTNVEIRLVSKIGPGIIPKPETLTVDVTLNTALLRYGKLCQLLMIALNFEQQLINNMYRKMLFVCTLQSLVAFWLTIHDIIQLMGENAHAFTATKLMARDSML